MKVLHFKHEDVLLERMENVEAVKKNKAAFYFHPDHRIKWQEAIKNGEAKETLFKDTTIVCIPITPTCNKNLFVIDCDNQFSGEFILQKIIEFGVETLITYSPYGFHIYFYDNEPVPLKAIRQSEDGLAIDFFNTQTHKTGHIIFDGAHNPYYAVHQLSSDEPCEIPKDFKDWLVTTFDLLATEHNMGINVKEKKLFKPNRARWDRIIKPALKKGELDVPTFRTAFEYNRDGLIYTDRNNTLSRISAWAGVCGYFENYEQWVEFMLVVNRSLNAVGLFGNKGELGENEIRNTICAKSKWDKLFFTENETITTQIRNIEIRQTLTNYIAINLSATSGKNVYLHILQNSPSDIKIMEVLNKSVLLELCKNDSELYEHYVYIDDKEREILRESNFIPVRIIHSFSNNTKLYTEGVDNVRIINPLALSMNPLVSDIINGRDNIELLDEAQFKELPFMKVFYTNLAPDPLIADKFLHDLAYCLRNNVGLVNVPFFWDIYGGSGKGLVLNTMIDYFFFNKDFNHDRFANELNLDVPIAAPRISAKNFVEVRFNSEFASNAVIIDEDGFNAREARNMNKAFASKLKEVAKAEFLRIEKKGQNSYLRPNNVFIIRCLNSLLNPIPQDEANTRIYVSRCVKIMQDAELTAIYNDKQRIIREDLPKILKYILINYPNDSIRFAQLPKTTGVDGWDINYFVDDFTSFVKHFSRTIELQDETLILDWYRLFFIQNAPNEHGIRLELRDGVLDKLIELYFAPDDENNMSKRIIGQTIGLLANMVAKHARTKAFIDKFTAFGLYSENSKFQNYNVENMFSADNIFRRLCSIYQPKIECSTRLRAELISIINIQGIQTELSENPF